MEQEQIDGFAAELLTGRSSANLLNSQEDPYKDAVVEAADEAEERIGARVLELLFPKWALPIELIVRTWPAPGTPSVPIYLGWVHSTHFTVQLPEDAEFPLSVRAFRHYKELSEHMRNGKKVFPADPKTWPPEYRWSGIQHKLVFHKGRMAALCTHKPKCPPTLDFPGGIVYDGDSAWVLTHNNPVMREEDFVAKMTGKEVAKPAEVELPEGDIADPLQAGPTAPEKQPEKREPILSKEEKQKKRKELSLPPDVKGREGEVRDQKLAQVKKSAAALQASA